jgi:hypothetical protein
VEDRLHLTLHLHTRTRTSHTNTHTYTPGSGSGKGPSTREGSCKHEAIARTLRPDSDLSLSSGVLSR